MEIQLFEEGNGRCCVSDFLEEECSKIEAVKNDTLWLVYAIKKKTMRLTQRDISTARSKTERV